MGFTASKKVSMEGEQVGMLERPWGATRGFASGMASEMSFGLGTSASTAVMYDEDEDEDLDEDGDIFEDDDFEDGEGEEDDEFFEDDEDLEEDDDADDEEGEDDDEEL